MSQVEFSDEVAGLASFVIEGEEYSEDGESAVVPVAVLKRTDIASIPYNFAISAKFTLNAVEKIIEGIQEYPLKNNLIFETWDVALKLAGLASTSYKVILDEELFSEIERLWIKEGQQPTATDIKNGKSKYSLNTFSRRFGGWRKALEAFVAYVNATENDSDDSEYQANTTSSNEPCIDEKGINEFSKNKKRTPRDINLRLRFKVLSRDCFKCCICGASPAKDPSVELHVDHIIPWSKGGETELENLQTLCSKCNLGKSNLM